MKIVGLPIPDGCAGTYHSSTLTIEELTHSRRNGYFWFALDSEKCAARLNDIAARKLRDELTAFLGDDDRHFLCDNTNLCANARWYKTETERLQGCLKESERQFQGKVAEIHGLTDANEALRRDNADLTRQKDRLIAEAETLRQRVASLEKDLADAKKAQRMDNNEWQEIAANYADQITALEVAKEDLRAENARLKVDLMNARAGMTAITIGDWSRITGY